MGSEKSPTCLQPSQKISNKLPKRIHKAEREKLKREHLNELFLELADALELADQNSGKASILGETTRVVKDMLDQIKSVKKENAALLSESQYVTVEKNELKDETCILQNQIGELKSMINETTVQKNLDLNAPAVESQEPQLPQYFHHEMIHLTSGDPILIIPACHNVRTHPQPDSGSVLRSIPKSNVSKPNPRYPTPSDSWPLQLLEKTSQEEQ
ncbi:transcription factor bHLH47-like [Rutidosis leptorrhynchoides]|uniref:transcription factor bHLH47-like n=1 Tax=Rutidosis leptorrhynchoides TaxID=125765 RepID=UPI003A9A34BE